MLNFIAHIKEKIRREAEKDASYLSLTVKNGHGIKIGDSYVFCEPFTSGKVTFRIFSPLDTAVKRVDEQGDLAIKSNL